MTTQTLESLNGSFQSYLQAQNSKINAYAPFSMWSIISGAVSSTFLDLYYNLQLVDNAIYPQNAVGDQVDKWLYRLGLPARVGQTYANIVVNITAPTSATIPAFTQFTDSTTNNVYQNLTTISVTTAASFTLYAINPGNNYFEEAGSELTNSALGITVEVVVSTAGQLEETDQSCINRILQATQAPLSGARQTDYAAYCLQANEYFASPTITGSIIVPSFYVFETIGILGAFPLIGSPQNDYQLDQGLLTGTTFQAFTRQAGSDVLNAVTNTVQAQRLVGVPILVGACYTYNTISIDAAILVPTGYSADTLIQVPSQDSSGNPITISLTVEQLIQRELRRAINNQPFGATFTGTQNIITLDSLIYAVNLQLSALNGQLAKLILNISISGGDIVVPSSSYSSTDLYYIYDVVEYSDISLTITTQG